jgi:hypothetical protein
MPHDFPLLAPTTPPHRAICTTAVELRPLCFPRPSNRPCPFPRPHSTFTCRLLSRPGSCRRRSQAAADAAAGPRRAPTPAISPPQLWPSLGQVSLWSSLTTSPAWSAVGSQELAGAVSPPWPRAALQGSRSFQGVLCNLGACVSPGKHLGVSMKKRNFNSIVTLLILVKSLENRRKLKKCKLNFSRLLVKSTTTFVKLV